MMRGKCQTIGRRVFAPLFVFFLLSALIVPITQAAVSAPRLQETDWRTGEIEVKYTGATPGYMMTLYAATYESEGAFQPIDSWTIKESEESHITSYLENGQSIWFYVRQVDPASLEYTTSQRLKQTPPITAFIINWPDMLKDLDTMINNALEKAMTPSQDAQDRLKDAVDAMKNAIGAGSAGNAGSQMQDAINQGQNGMSPPIVKDDGNGTYTGGSTGGKLPQNPTTGDGGLTYPNPDSGTATEMTIRFPYGVDMKGNLLYVQIFTKEQMEKMKWWDVVRTLAGVTVWIAFAVWLVQRFTPQLKV
jgi:hypothetical protein